MIKETKEKDRALKELLCPQRAYYIILVLGFSTRILSQRVTHTIVVVVDRRLEWSERSYSLVGHCSQQPVIHTTQYTHII